MRLVLVVLVVLVAGVGGIAAQADTPTPSPAVPTPGPTFTPYSFEDMVGTLGIPTPIPALSLTPKAWSTPARVGAGTPFQVPDFPAFGEPGAGENPVEHGFEAISEVNSLKLGEFFATTAVTFYGWLVVNFPGVVKTLRIVSILLFLMLVLFMILRRFAPKLSAAGNSFRGRFGNRSRLP